MIVFLYLSVDKYKKSNMIPEWLEVKFDFSGKSYLKFSFAEV